MYNSVKQLAILGSTGSIGRQTLQIVRSFPGQFRVIALAAGNNLALLSRQVEEFKPQFVFYQTESGTRKPEIPGQFLSMEEMAVYPTVNTVVVATSGKAGLMATLAAVSAGKMVAIANKEPLVMAGEIITSQAELTGASIMPVDSEHSAIWQCLENETQPLSQIILTASGGPFRNYSLEQLQKVTPKQALKHPSWEMGKKVTIDSSTLMNKGLEVIEAHWIFGVPFEKIRVVVHPQSIIHSMVEFADGSVKAQLAYPDMRLPIQYALSYPNRLANPELPRIDWDKLKELTFEVPDFNNFPCLKLGIEAGIKGGTAPTVLCAADEVAVDLFLAGKIPFTDIPRLIGQVFDAHTPITASSIENILTADAWAREYIQEIVK
jgi:1-deoxy-D-xylulose-5-phosphate reductoisomerase